MDLKTPISETVPEPIASVLRDVYYVVSNEPDPRRLRREWKENNEDYEEVVTELTSADFYKELTTTVEELTNSGMIGRESAQDIYYLVRTREPECVVETGVCNGMSSSVILAALERNDCGELHSIDIPFHAEVPYQRRQKETFDGIGHAEIPSNKEVGWLIPDQYRDRWEFYEGKSQHLLPGVMEKNDADMFIHDSEHSHPCMMFEMETAWHRMDDGIIFLDDISWNSAFDVFTEVRAEEHRQISRSTGYIMVK